MLARRHALSLDLALRGGGSAMNAAVGETKSSATRLSDSLPRLERRCSVSAMGHQLPTERGWREHRPAIDSGNGAGLTLLGDRENAPYRCRSRLAKGCRR